MTTKKQTPEKKVLKLKEQILSLKEKNNYLENENRLNEIRREYERPRFYFNFRETVKKTVELLLIPTLISIIYFCIK